MDCSLPDPSIHGILPARILEWVAISSSRESFRPRNWTHISLCFLDWQVGSLPLVPPGKTFKVAKYLKKEATKSKVYDYANTHPHLKQKQSMRDFVCDRALYVIREALPWPEFLCRNMVTWIYDSSGISKSEKIVMLKGYYGSHPAIKMDPGDFCLLVSMSFWSLAPCCRGSSVWLIKYVTSEARP